MREVATVDVRSITPDHRLGLLPVVRANGWCDLEGKRVRVAPGTLDLPSYMLLHDRSLVVEVEGTANDAFAHIERLVTTTWLADTLPVEASIVVALDEWDSLFRHHELFSGNVYLSSEESVARLLRLSADVDIDAIDVRQRLDELQALELIYRFPAALKFRGEFSDVNQCRLNGWGRRLARSLRDAEPDSWRVMRKRLDAHVIEEQERYRVTLSSLVRATDDGDAAAIWSQVSQLPIGIVV